MISSRAFSLIRKPFFPTTCRSFWTFYGHENRNIIRSFMDAKPWHSNYMRQSKEIPKCNHRFSFLVLYSTDLSGSNDFPTIVKNGSKIVHVRVSSSYIWIEPARRICYRHIGAIVDGVPVKDGQEVKINYKLYSNSPDYKVRYDTRKKHGPQTVGPDTNDEGLYEGIVGMRLRETRRIVVLPSSDLTSVQRLIKEKVKRVLKNKPSRSSKEHGIYDVELVEISDDKLDLETK
ncbi:hypothetical protein NC652_029066 [Populus alba x Populus x berolinensis]|nr:hypothetical protein NC652_029066 [Populus alba x Populus x berolinensis]